MRTTGFFIIIPLVLVLYGCKTLAPKSQEYPFHGWTQQDVMSRILSRSVPHHWGQKDQEVSNNGWSKYAYLKYKQENLDKFVVFKQSQGELSAEFYITNIKKMHAVSIPGGGIFYKGDMATTCMPDHIESPGLEAELFLFILSKAFPDGPEKINRKMSVRVHGDKERTLRFMQAYGQLPRDWNAEVTIEPVAVSQYVISMLLQTSMGSEQMTLQLHWKGKGDEVVSSSDLLSNWLTCWHGHTPKEGEGYRHIPYVKDAETLQTFGQLRSKLRSP